MDDTTSQRFDNILDEATKPLHSRIEALENENRELCTASFSFQAMRKVSEKLGCGHGNAEILRAIDAIIHQRDNAYRVVQSWKRVAKAKNICDSSGEMRFLREDHIRITKEGMVIVEGDVLQDCILSWIENGERRWKESLTGIQCDEYRPLAEKIIADWELGPKPKPLVRITSEGNVLQIPNGRVVSWFEDGVRKWGAGVAADSLVRLQADKLVATWAAETKNQ